MQDAHRVNTLPDGSPSGQFVACTKLASGTRANVLRKNCNSRREVGRGIEMGGRAGIEDLSQLQWASHMSEEPTHKGHVHRVSILACHVVSKSAQPLMWGLQNRY